jgi:hypothetical protein
VPIILNIGTACPERCITSQQRHLSARWTCRRPGRAAVQPRRLAASKAHAAREGGPAAQLPCAEMTLSTAPAMPALMVYGPAC